MLINSNSMSKEQATWILDSIDVLQKRLTEAENQFSYNMSEAARWAANLFFVVMIIFTIIGSILCFITCDLEKSCGVSSL